MRRENLQTRTLVQLIERFADIAIAQDDALLNSDISKFNRLYDRMDEVDSELRARGTEARQALLQLYSHPNLQVRLKAAVRSLGVAPSHARRLLEDLRKSGAPQALDAGMTLRGLDEGSFKPT